MNEKNRESEKYVVLKKDGAGNVIESTIPLPKEYIEELVPPFPVDNNTFVEPFDFDKEAEKQRNE